jgi:hypothetical protein
VAIAEYLSFMFQASLEGIRMGFFRGHIVEKYNYIKSLSRRVEVCNSKGECQSLSLRRD